MEIPFHRPYVTDDEISSIAESIRNGWLTMGEKTGNFEKRFNEYIGSKEAIAVNSCTAALHLALTCAGLEEGDEVIIPTITHASTAEVVGYFRAQPALVDIERDTHLLNASMLEKQITNKTKAIIPVHYAGQPVDMDEILDIAKKNNLFVIEDAAHAFPSKYNNKYIGTFGDATCFSFYATKTLSTGEGGMITTDNSEWADRMKTLRLHGVTKDAWLREGGGRSWEYDVMEPGFKYNTTDINAAMGIEQLKIADYLQMRRANIAQKYNEAFKTREEIILYSIKEQRETSWHLYPIRLNLETLSINRNQFINEMSHRGISTSVHFIPLYRLSYYKNLGYNINDYPDSEWVFEREVSLPIYPGMKDGEIEYVIDKTLDILNIFKR